MHLSQNHKYFSSLLYMMNTANMCNVPAFSKGIRLKVTPYEPGQNSRYNSATN